MTKLNMAMQMLDNYVHHMNSLNYDRENNRRDDTDLASLSAVFQVCTDCGFKITQFGKDIGGKWFFTGAVLTMGKTNIGLWALRYSADNLHDFMSEFKDAARKRFGDEIIFMFEN